MLHVPNSALQSTSHQFNFACAVLSKCQLYTQNTTQVIGPTGVRYFEIHGKTRLTQTFHRQGPHIWSYTHPLTRCGKHSDRFPRHFCHFLGSNSVEINMLLHSPKPSNDSRTRWTAPPVAGLAPQWIGRRQHALETLKDGLGLEKQNQKSVDAIRLSDSNLCRKLCLDYNGRSFHIQDS